MLALVVPAAQQKFKVSTASVPVYVTVTDQQRRLVPDLVQDDFEMLDNGKLQNVNIFENKPTPITTIVMIDSSGSMTVSLDLVKDGAEQFLIRLLPEDQGQVGAFNDKIEFHPATEFTSDRDALVSYLKQLDFGYPTRLYDAIDESLARFENLDGRRVVLVFTDGDDTASKISSGHVMDRARAKDVMVYAIGLVNEYFNGQMRVRSQPDRDLRKLAEDTGGGYFELKKTADLNETFTRVAHGAAQHVRARLLARDARWQGPQARRPSEEAGHDRQGPQDVSCGQRSEYRRQESVGNSWR